MRRTRLLKLLGLRGDVAMPQTPEEIERRALTERLIEEHRRANDAALQQLKTEAPAVASRYLSAMDQAMSIIRGG